MKFKPDDFNAPINITAGRVQVNLMLGFLTRGWEHTEYQNRVTSLTELAGELLEGQVDITVEGGRIIYSGSLRDLVLERLYREAQCLPKQENG